MTSQKQKLSPGTTARGGTGSSTRSASSSSGSAALGPPCSLSWISAFRRPGSFPWRRSSSRGPGGLPLGRDWTFWGWWFFRWLRSATRLLSLLGWRFSALWSRLVGGLLSFVVHTLVQSSSLHVRFGGGVRRAPYDGGTVSFRGAHLGGFLLGFRLSLRCRRVTMLVLLVLLFLLLFLLVFYMFGGSRFFAVLPLQLRRLLPLFIFIFFRLNLFLFLLLLFALLFLTLDMFHCPVIPFRTIRMLGSFLFLSVVVRLAVTRGVSLILLIRLRGRWLLLHWRFCSRGRPRPRAGFTRLLCSWRHRGFHGFRAGVTRFWLLLSCGRGWFIAFTAWATLWFLGWLLLSRRGGRSRLRSIGVWGRLFLFLLWFFFLGGIFLLSEILAFYRRCWTVGRGWLSLFQFLCFLLRLL